MSPAINCSICNQVRTISTKDWKLILHDEPYVCSSYCVLEWVIQGWRSYPYRVDVDGMLWNRPVSNPIFRSNFEERVFSFFKKNNVLLQHEAYTFKVGNGSYTPDFWIPISGAFIETKGKWQLGQRTKFKKFRAQYPDVLILIIPWTIQSEF